MTKEKLTIKKVVNPNKATLKIITEWFFNWWGKKNGLTYEEVQCYAEHSVNNSKLPQIFGLFLNNKIIGMYEFVLSDFEVRPDIYPWLANVYIDEKYRGKGYGRVMLETVKKSAQENLNFNEIYLYTHHIGLYEKFGWEFVSDFNTFSKVPKIQRLYKLNLK